MLGEKLDPFCVIACSPLSRCKRFMAWKLIVVAIVDVVVLQKVKELTPEKWRAAFDSEGRLVGFHKLLKVIRKGVRSLQYNIITRSQMLR